MKKYALVTGASGDIGSAIAISLARAGYSLYLHYNKNEQRIHQLQEQIGKERATLIQADLSEKSGVDKLLSQIRDEIDVIIHNSGNSYYGLLTDMKAHEIDEMIQLHLTSPVLITKQLLPTMIKKKTGKVIVISSIWGLTGASCEVLYSTVKGGLNTFVKALAKEVAPSGITVNSIAPGAIETVMLHHLSELESEEICEDIPMGRLGKPDEVANLVAFLLTDKASYINGQVISINGAWYC
ncbi:elongation factor P 5-aminopentanone reductase [Anaerobacillus sp. MEB173]|uniref:elongation factor P 5-aminopentanone reductase n=1 Tax=Anaerobacillus sp. MEB173 TaxID=3383345 RepID=UPI003F901411